MIQALSGVDYWFRASIINARQHLNILVSSDGFVGFVDYWFRAINNQRPTLPESWVIQPINQRPNPLNYWCCRAWMSGVVGLNHSKPIINARQRLNPLIFEHQQSTPDNARHCPYSIHNWVDSGVDYSSDLFEKFIWCSSDGFVDYWFDIRRCRALIIDDYWLRASINNARHSGPTASIIEWIRASSDSGAVGRWLLVSPESTHQLIIGFEHQINHSKSTQLLMLSDLNVGRCLLMLETNNQYWNQ